MPYNILIVDDNKDFREAVREYLYDYEVVEASTGKEALGILKKPNEIDLVLLDVMMRTQRYGSIEKDKESGSGPWGRHSYRP